MMKAQGTCEAGDGGFELLRVLLKKVTNLRFAVGWRGDLRQSLKLGPCLHALGKTKIR